MLLSIFRFFGFFFSALTIGLVFAGILVLAALWYYGQDLPDHEVLAQYQPPTLSRIYSAQGDLMDEFARERRIYTPIDEIPDLVKNAFISAEDKNFYRHSGFDPLGIVKAALEAAKGGRKRGASTITQQVMKNFLLSGDRSAERKIKEILLANRLEQVLNKDEILGIYLNEIFLGQNSYGVTAAAQTYFNKTLEELSVGEAAYLASLPKAPSDRHPVTETEQAIFWRNNTIREMAENGYITAEVAEAETAAPLLSVQGGDYSSRVNSLQPRDYFSDEIRRELTVSLGEEKLFGGGLSIRATVNPDLQKVAAAALRQQLVAYDRDQGQYRGPVFQLDPSLLGDEAGWRTALAEAQVPRDIDGWYPAVILELGETSARIGIEGVDTDEDGHFLDIEEADWARPRDADGGRGGKPDSPDDLWAVGDVIFVGAVETDGAFEKWTFNQIPEVQGAFMAMDTRTGRVIAMQGGFSYQSSVFNRATQAMRQPGSAFKPFVYAAALDNGYTPGTIVVDAPIEVDTPQGVWRPQNSSNKYYGPAPLRTGIEQSRNLMTVRVAQDIGMDVVAEYAERFGVYDEMQEVLANALGAGETTLLKMVTAYSMFANGGIRVEPTLVDRVQDRDGNTIYQHDARICHECQQTTIDVMAEPWVENKADRIMDAVTAYQLSAMMRGVVERGTAASTVGVLGVPISGKTGTTNDAKDVWFIGFTPKIAAGCYIGFDTPRNMGPGAFGGTLCGPVFSEFMRVALENHGSYDMPVPPNSHFVKLDRYTGERLADDMSGEWVVAELFRDGEEPDYGAFGAFVDGGFVMGRDLLLFARGESENLTVTLDGEAVILPPTATFGTLSSGGLY